MQKFHHLLGCHAADIKLFFKCFAFFKFNIPSQKSDKKAVLTRLRIITMCLAKKLI